MHGWLLVVLDNQRTLKSSNGFKIIVKSGNLSEITKYNNLFPTTLNMTADGLTK